MTKLTASRDVGPATSVSGDKLIGTNAIVSLSKRHTEFPGERVEETCRGRRNIMMSNNASQQDGGECDEGRHDCERGMDEEVLSGPGM